MNRTDRIAGSVIVILHLVGMIGMLSPWREFFIPLTPANLLLSMMALFAVIQPRTPVKALSLLAIFSIGFLAEWVGVHTGLLFGEYTYGKTLGLKISEIPLLIGVNWILVTASAYSIARGIGNSRLFRIVFATVLMVALDYFIEPVAMELDFWTWEGNVIPFKNYIGWAGVSLLTTWIYHRAFQDLEVRNTPKVLYFSMLGFFVILNSSL